MNAKRSLCLAVVYLVPVLAARCPCFAQGLEGYEVVQITYDSWYKHWNLSINNCGEIVWGSRTDYSTDSEIFLYDNGHIAQITDNDVSDMYPDINDAGVIAWSSWIDPKYKIFIYEDGEVHQLTYDDLDNKSPHINNQGHVLWNSFNSEGCGSADSHVYLYDGESIMQISSGPFSDQMEQFNDFDEIVWKRHDICVSPEVVYIMHYSDGVITELSTGEHNPSTPHINNLHQAVWISRWPEGGMFVQYWDGGEPWMLADEATTPLINNNGWVAMIRPGWGEGRQTWLWYPGLDEPFQITRGPELLAALSLNDFGEMVLMTGGYPNSDLFILRRIRDGDINFDSVVDLDDFATFPDCTTGPVETDRLCDCRFFDMDHDRDVDLADMALFQTAFGG